MSKKSVSKYGFRRDSPYKNKGKLVIQSNVIDMNDTDFPLLLVPDNDEPVVAPAQSGGYFFPNSNSVTEYRLDKLPKFNKGGKTKKTRRSLRAEPEPVYGSYQKENRSAKRIARDYSLSDFIISPEDLQEMTEAELNCNTGNCLGSASQYFNFYVAPKLGLDDTWTQKAHAPSGPNNPRFADYGASVDSWDIHRVLTEDGGLPVFRGTGYMDYMMEPIPEDKRISISTIFPREQDREDFFKSLPVGTVVGYKYGYAAGGDSYDVKSGETIKDSRHSAIVIGYTPDGKPILFDNTKRKVIDQTMYDMDDITNITVPRTAADSNFNYFKVTGELTPTKFDYTQDSRNKVLFGIPDRLLEGPDADEFDPFIKTLKDEKGTLASVLNLSDEEYNNYYKTAAAIALKETKGGNDLVIRKKSVNTPLGKVNIPIPSYVTDKAANKIEKILEKRGLGDSDAAKFLSKNVGARTGITQLNVKDFWKTPRTAQAATKIGLTPDSDPFDPSVMAKMTMIWLRELDLNTRNADVSISTPDRLNVAWNRGQGFFNRNARKKTLNLQTPDQKRFNKEYDNISILDASYNTAVPNVGTYDDPLLDVGSLSEITIVPGGYEVSDERYPRPTSPPIPQRVTSQQEAAPSQIISPVPSTKLIKRAQPNVNDNFEIPPPPTTAPWEKPYQWDSQSKKYYREWTAEEMQERMRMQELADEIKNNPITPIELLPQRPLGQLKAGGRLKSSQQDLVDWTNQNWRTKSGKPSHETGERYLPEDAIKALSDAEYQRTSQKKRSDGGVGNVSSQPDNIADKVRKYRMRDGGSTVNAAGNYTKPDMRKRLFEDIKGSNVMGTPAGKWSARKAQLLAKRYKEQGGGYKQMGGIVETPDGFYIEEPELMQKGGPIANPISNDLTNQEYADLYNEGRVHTYDPDTDTYNASVLPEVEIRGSAPKSWRDFARRYNKKISDDHKGSLAQALFVAPVTAAMNAPQAAATYWASKNKALVPSEAMEIKNPYLASAVDLGADMISDPLIISGLARAGIKGGFKLGKYAIKNAASFKNKTKKDLDLEKLRRSYSTERFSEPEDVIDLTHLNIFDPIDYDAFLQNYNFQQVSPTLRKVTNKSGLTKDEVIAKASSKDKDVISKMSEAEFKETVLKPTGEIVPYQAGKIAEGVIPGTKKEWADNFNNKIHFLNQEISRNNTSGIKYKVNSIDNDGAILVYTPRQVLPDGRIINEGQNVLQFKINPGTWDGVVEDISSMDYHNSIPGLRAYNTAGGIFPDNSGLSGTPGTGFYTSLNNYMKKMNLGRLKDGASGQTRSIFDATGKEIKRGSYEVWEGNVAKNKAVGFLTDEGKQVSAVMRNLFPYVGIGGAGALGANQLSQKPESYQYGGTFNYSIEETPEGYFINETSN